MFHHFFRPYLISLYKNDDCQLKLALPKIGFLYFYRNKLQKIVSVYILFLSNIQGMRTKNIDMWRLDPNWKFASQHGQASRTGFEDPNAQHNRKNSILMCPCCLNIIHKQPVSLCENPKQLNFLGYGFPLFYNMVQYCMMALFLLILTQASLLIYLAVSQDCNQRSPVYGKNYSYPCQSWFIKIARVTYDPSELQIDRIIRSLAYIGQAILLVYLRDVQRKLSAYHDERNTRIKDFSVIFRNLPKITKIQKNIRQFIQNLENEQPIKIEEIFLMPKIDNFHELQQEKMEIINHLKRIMKQKKPSQLLKKSLQAQLQRVNLQMIETCKRTDQLYQRDQLFSDKAIVILQSKEKKKYILEKFSQILQEEKERYFFWMANSVTLQSAPQPRQIIWSNINYPKYKRWLRVILGWTLSIVFLAIATGIFYFLVVFKAQSHSMTLLIITLILIQFFNKYIMKIFLHWFSDIQMPQTSSDRQFSYACKYTIGMFFTTAIMSIIVEAVIYNNLEFEYGLVEGQTIMFFFNAFAVNLLWILHPQYYLKKLSRWRKYGTTNITQKQANQIMEDYPYDMGKRYAQIIETMWFTFLYVTLIPIGAFLSLLGLWMYYWIDKYNLLRRSKIQNTIESKLPLNAVKLIQCTLFWNALGNLIFDMKIRDYVFPQTYAMLAISIVFLLIPWDFFLDVFLNEKFKISTQAYQDVKYRFNQTYQTVDPIQRMLSLQRFIEGQNKARKKVRTRKDQQKFHSFLQIQQYQQRKQDESIARQMVRQEIPQTSDDFSIKLKFSQQSFQPTND